MDDFARERARMVEEQLETRGIKDPQVLNAMGAVPRELFVSQHNRKNAYEDRPLPIGSGQTISQPYIVAFMISALQLRGGENVLEVGAGCGYAAAVIGQIAKSVTAIECVESLALLARKNLETAGIGNVEIIHADGNQGWQENAPYDAILVSAAASEIPDTLLEQLKDDGRMIVPVGDARLIQQLMLITKLAGGETKVEPMSEVRFVPLVGG